MSFRFVDQPPRIVALTCPMAARCHEIVTKYETMRQEKEAEIAKEVKVS
jgi:hypothetical protein